MHCILQFKFAIKWRNLKCPFICSDIRLCMKIQPESQIMLNDDQSSPAISVQKGSYL